MKLSIGQGKTKWGRSDQNFRCQSINLIEHALVLGEAIEEPTINLWQIHNLPQVWKVASCHEGRNEVLIKNETLQIVHKPKKQRIVQCKWLYKVKEDSNTNETPR